MAAANGFEQRPATSLERRIVLLNDVPLRQHATAECKRSWAKLNQARAEWHRYEQEDQPAFARWTAATFGPLLTRLRENELLLEKQEAFIAEVEIEMIWGEQHNPHRAYAAVKKEWDNPDPGDDSAGVAAAKHVGDAAGFDPRDPIASDWPDGARQALFEEFVRAAGADPKRMSKTDYEEKFADFEKTLFEEAAMDESAASRDKKKPIAVSAAARLKEIYRILVRRLHPDLRAGTGATVSLMWHEVQEAYQAQNLERLETLLALTQMQDGTESGQASLADMRRALKELRRSLQDLQRSINEAKGAPAWGFSQTQNHVSLEKRIRQELEVSLSRQRKALAVQQRILDQWARPGHAPAKRPRARRGVEVANAEEADLFAF